MAEMGKRGGLSLCTGLAGALIYDVIVLPLLKLQDEMSIDLYSPHTALLHPLSL